MLNRFKHISLVRKWYLWTLDHYWRKFTSTEVSECCRLLSRWCWVSPHYTSEQLRQIVVVVRSPTMAALRQEVTQIHHAVCTTNRDQKYLTRLPEWFQFDPAREPLRDYLVDNGFYVDIRPELEVLCQQLQEIHHALDQPHNVEFKDYYLRRMRRVYTDVISVTSVLPL